MAVIDEGEWMRVLLTKRWETDSRAYGSRENYFCWLSLHGGTKEEDNYRCVT